MRVGIMREDKPEYSTVLADHAQPPDEFLLLDRLDGLGMHLLVLNLRGVPASAQRFDQVHRGDHLLAEELCRQALIVEQRRLRGDDVEVAGDSANVAVVGQVPESAGHRRRLRSAW